jgi:hypothetical protein
LIVRYLVEGGESWDRPHEHSEEKYPRQIVRAKYLFC